MLLHAEHLGFAHPHDGRRIDVRAPGDREWQRAMTLLGFDAAC
jgi:tRNA pseudouridine65 synthase